MKIYVASSWRNDFHPAVVHVLREQGFEVYDFKDSEGFSWREISPNWQAWTKTEYLQALTHQLAERGFNRDMAALKECDICVMVMPCGMSASLEMGYAVGAKKHTICYVPALREPDLMVKMCDHITASLDMVVKFCNEYRDSRRCDIRELSAWHD